MIELLFAGLLIGASVTILSLHFSKRLKPLPSAEKSYSGTSFGMLGMNLAGNNPSMDEMRYERMVATVLQQPKNDSGWKTLLP